MQKALHGAVFQSEHQYTWLMDEIKSKTLK